MNTNYRIKNFRAFNEDGVDIELAPITILTGRNSAGKSSVVKAIALLNSFLMQIRKDKESGERIDFSKYKIEFNKLFDGLLGNFESILHKHSDDKTITFEYTIHSTMLFEDVKVSFAFIDEDYGKNESYMHNGILYQFCVKTMQDDVIYSSCEGKFHYNLNLIKDKFKSFVLGELYAHAYLGYYSMEGKEEEWMHETRDKAKHGLLELDETIRNDIYKYIRDPFSSKYPILQSDENEAFSSFLRGGHLFYVPVIEDYLVNLNKEEIPMAVEEILSHNVRIDKKENFVLDENQKCVIKRLINDILATDKRIDDYWKEQEDSFLASVGDERNLLKDRLRINLFYKFTRQGVFMPDSFLLDIGQSFWMNYPGHWTYGNEDKTQKEREIEKWKNEPIDNFLKKYEILMRLNSAYHSWMKENDTNYAYPLIYSYEENIDFPAGRYTHVAYKLLCEYASRAIENLLFPDWCENFVFIPSSRAIPKRIYVPDNNNDFYLILNEYLKAKSEFERDKELYRVSTKGYTADSFLNYWIGKDGFSVGKSISIESVLGSAIVVKLKKENGEEVFLTDEGFGLTQLVSILICIETSILKAKGVQYNNYYGLSTLDGLETQKFYYERQTIAIEEPEIHLHPEFQSKLADMFLSASQYNIHFIVETHSEYLIRELQVLAASKQLTNTDGIIYYLDRKTDQSTSSQVNIISIRKNGTLDGNFGKGFFNEASERVLDLLKYDGEDDE